MEPAGSGSIPKEIPGSADFTWRSIRGAARPHRSAIDTIYAQREFANTLRSLRDGTALSPRNGFYFATPCAAGRGEPRKDSLLASASEDASLELRLRMRQTTGVPLCRCQRVFCLRRVVQRSIAEHGEQDIAASAS